MPLQATSGAASQDAFGGNGVAVVPTYIEDVFSTYLYTGTGAALTITNNIDLSTKGGLTWIKGRSGATGHRLTDTARGVTKSLESNSTAAEATESTGLTAFGTTGFTIGADADYNTSAATYASWTFRKQPKFFDVVTWTGNGTGNRSIPHLLNSTPAFIQTKRTDSSESWWNHHRSVTSPNANWWRNYGALNSVNAFADWGDDSGLYQAPDANNLYIGSYYNTSGKTYVAYLFAHDAGGFGLTGTDNVISCGSYTGNNTSLQSINLGYEPQLVLIKSAATAGTEWVMLDNMRGVATGGVDAVLNPNTSGAEASPFDRVDFTSTGFNLKTSSSIYNETGTYIYIAIRRGPMKVPTTGTSVFSPIARTGTGAAVTVTGAGFAPDLALIKSRTNGRDFLNQDRLRGISAVTFTSSDNGDFSSTNYVAGFDVMDGVRLGTVSTVNGSSPETYINYFFRRAPSFMDVVCDTGTGSAHTITHNLNATPELILRHTRGTTPLNWRVYAGDNTDYLALNTTAATADLNTVWNDASPTSTNFTVGTENNVNVNGTTYVTYLFATCAGVSKVFSYTGNGSSQTINCGFTGGARFVLIKRTDSTGDWVTFDSARGIVAGNDPYLFLNTTSAENVYGAFDEVDADSSGFIVNQNSGGNNLNVSSATYIGLAIA